MITKSLEWTRKILRLRSPESIDNTVKQIQEEAWREGMSDAADMAAAASANQLAHDLRERATVKWMQ